MRSKSLDEAPPFEPAPELQPPNKVDKERAAEEAKNDLLERVFISSSILLTRTPQPQSFVILSELYRQDNYSLDQYSINGIKYAMKVTLDKIDQKYPLTLQIRWCRFHVSNQTPFSSQ